MRAALLNQNTETVESIIIVNSLEDIVPEGYKLLEIPLEDDYIGTVEEQQLFEIIREIDPEYFDEKQVKVEKKIYPGTTKWSEELGFYEE